MISVKTFNNYASMKLILNAIAFFTSVSLISVITNVYPAQSSQTNSATVTTKNLKISQAQTKLDKDLFVKALKNFFGSSSYLTESESWMQVKTGAADITFKIKTKTIAQSGKKFSSQIVFDDSTKKKEYLVISDGQTVWIYESALKQYSMIGYDDFRESFFIGLSSLLFTEIPEDARAEISKNKSSNEEIIAAIGLNNTGQQLKQEKSLIDNQEMVVYRYKDPKDDMEMSGFVEPLQGSVKQIQMAGQSEGFNILMNEKIVQRTPNPTITDQTFKFSPPPGAKKVKSVSIEPF
jgi:outer membrane lipoprotein-sorting protein